MQLYEQNGDCPKLIRIVCKELEAWYLGDFLAIHKVYNNFKYKSYDGKAKFRIPDICNAYFELKKYFQNSKKLDGQRKLLHLST